MNLPTPPYDLAKIPSDYLAPIEATAISGAEIVEYFEQIIAQDPDNIFLVGCGGSLFTFDALHNILDRSPLPVFRFNADELLLRRPANFGAKSLVIISSSNGKTSETARAAKFAGELGAIVVGVTQDPDSVVANECAKVFLHKGVEAKQILLAQIGWSILKALNVAPEFDRVWRALQASPRAFLESIHETDDILAEIAYEFYEEPMLYVLGSGPLYGAAQTLAMCYLQEMQWKNAAAVGSGEFLHGPFEVVTEGLPVLVLLGEDPTRAMGDRVTAFLSTHTKKLRVIDAAMLKLDGIDLEMRPLVSTLVVGSAILNRLAEHFQSRSGHLLKERRYMWKIDY